MPGWEGSTRRTSLPKDWETIRRRILKRDNYRCVHVRFDTGELCGKYANQVDHKYQNRRWDHSDGNLQSLCEHHHLQKSGAEGGRAAQAKRRAFYPRPKPKKHPGLTE